MEEASILWLEKEIDKAFGKVYEIAKNNSFGDFASNEENGTNNIKLRIFANNTYQVVITLNSYGNAYTDFNSKINRGVYKEIEYQKLEPIIESGDFKSVPTTLKEIVDDVPNIYQVQYVF